MAVFSLFAALRGEYPQREASLDCSTHGSYAVREFLSAEGEALGHFPNSCPVCAQAVRDAEAERERSAAIVTRIADAKIPRRFADAQLGNLQIDSGNSEGIRIARDYAARWPDQRRTGESLILLGPVGTGKTHIGVALLKLVAASGGSVRYATVSEVLREVRDTWSRRGDRTEKQIVEHFAGVSMLMLDEVGATHGSDSERVLLFDILNERYERLLPTIIAGNVTVAELDKSLDSRSVDRLRENGGKVAILKGASRRCASVTRSATQE